MAIWFITCKTKIIKKERKAKGPSETPVDMPWP